MRVSLLLLLLNNLFFVIMGVVFIRLKYWHIAILLFVFFNLWLGISRFGISLKTATDFLQLALLFSKIFIVRELCSNLDYRSFIFKCLVYYAIFSLLSGIIGTALFYLLPQNQGAYVGLTPVVLPFLILKIIYANILGIVLALFLVLLSGKRAMLVSAFVVLVLGFKKVSFKKSMLLFFPAFLIISFTITSLNFLENFSSGDKLATTIELIGGGDLDAINQSTGMRSFEVISIVSDMSLLDYFTGKGAGYTYELVIGSQVIDDSHSNAHFTPIGIISKYGVFIFLILVAMILRSFFVKGFEGRAVLFFKLYLASFCIEALFSYLIFNDKILAFVIGGLLAMSYRETSERYSE